jgi:pre-mRNA cleavage complex 2 protein Pcf11
MNSSSLPVFFFIFRFESFSSGCAEELPAVHPLMLDLISQETPKTIKIADAPKPVRFYGATSIVMLEWDDPREIGFQDGVRKVTIDDRWSVLCSFNNTHKECIIYGSTHRLVINISIITFIKICVATCIVFCDICL